MKINKIFSAVMAMLVSFMMLALPVNADEEITDDGNPVFAFSRAQTYTVEAGKKNEISIQIKNISPNDSKSTLITAVDEGGKLGITGNNISSLAIHSEMYTSFPVVLDVPATTLSGKYPLKLEFTAVNKHGVISEHELIADIIVKSNVVRNALSVSEYNISNGNVREGNIFDVNVTVKNGSGVAIDNARVELKNLDGQKFAMNKGVSYVISDFKKDEEKTFKFTVIACSGITSVRESIAVECSYYLDDADEDTLQKSEGVVTVSCSPKKTSGSEENVFAPNIIIKNYDFGADYVTGGKTFPLNVVITNTSNISAIKNLKVTVNGASGSGDKGIAFSPSNSSNSFFFEYLAQGADAEINLDMLTRADATPDSYPIEITFDYEYTTADGVEKANPVTETITIPVQQEDRFEVNSIDFMPECMVGEEVPISCTFVNKGKSSVYNVEVELIGDNIMTSQQKLYIGNVESGKEEYYDASFSAMEPGDFRGTVIVRYEDANGNLKEIEQEFEGYAMEMFFDEPVYDDGYIEDMPEEQGGFPLWAKILLIVGGIAIGIAVVIVVVVIIVKKKKANDALLLEDDEDY
ncbi:MAG: hypothetical protein J5992_03920 [Oscillospiraceae bacterium]|nr:hypothetical protein [Oscillospiraceae bacterium]